MPPFQLPLLEPHRAALETCVYCPKLSRAACPVSNAEGSETLTPWGKMSLAYFGARGDVPVDGQHAEPAWACTGCFACRERCEHKNEVATVLNDARAEYFARDAAPAPAKRIAREWSERAAQSEALSKALEREQGEGSSGLLLLIGCSYLRHAPDEARDALIAVEALTRTKAKLVHLCCGLPLLYAGDRIGFVQAATRFAQSVARADRLIVVDPGCARTLLVEYPRAGIEISLQQASKPELFVDLAFSHLASLHRIPTPLGEVPRYHDPCQLGRGLSRFQEPRALIARITGYPPREFSRSREAADCSGGGGLLPQTWPSSSRAIAEARIAEHEEHGGGPLITACAQSLKRFRSAGAKDVMDLATLIRKSITAT